MYWKDCTIPAQLFLRLLDRLQSVWQPELWQGDRLSMRIVQPTPAPPVGDQARLYILLECNRPRVGARKAILLSFQEFNSEGPSPDMTWIPYLAPEVITPPIIAGVLPVHCDPRHLIISAGTPDRRWLSEHEERAVADGLYLPILRDVRRAVPTQRIEVLAEDTGSSDDSSLMQLLSHTPPFRQCQPQDIPTASNSHLYEQPPNRITGFLSTHVIDRWCDSLPPLSYDDSMPSIRTFKPNPYLDHSETKNFWFYQFLFLQNHVRLWKAEKKEENCYKSFQGFEHMVFVDLVVYRSAEPTQTVIVTTWAQDL